MLSLVIPVYNNAESIPRLIEALRQLSAMLLGEFELVFVLDGPTDNSGDLIRTHLSAWQGRTQIVELSRNFGSFAAITAGLAHGTGDYFGVLAADLQEPPELMLEFHRLLATGSVDVVLGCRTRRADPWWSRTLATGFWALYRRFVVFDMPKGGVDVFACTRAVRDRLIELTEPSTNLIALVLWLGFRRAYVPYERRRRLEGRSGWTFMRRLRYAADSVFNFTDLPIRALTFLGAMGTLLAVAGGLFVFVMWWAGRIAVLGYTPLMLVITFFGGLTALGLGIVGQYLWLVLQNSRGRPNYVVRSVEVAGAHDRTAERNVS